MQSVPYTICDISDEGLRKWLEYVFFKINLNCFGARLQIRKDRIEQDVHSLNQAISDKYNTHIFDRISNLNQ